MNTPHDEDSLAQLLRVAGRREQPPPEAYRENLEVALRAWRRKVRSRQMQRHLAWAVAACVLLTTGVVFLLQRSTLEVPVSVASVERVLGVTHISSPGADWAPLSEETSLLSGTLLRTGEDSGAALRLTGGSSLRLAAQTRIALRSAERIELLSGRVYLDNPHAAGQRPIEIESPGGIARDVGTQFEVKDVDGDYRVRVREGRVQIRRGSRTLETRAGEEVSISDAGIVKRDRIATHGGEWRWTESLSPAPALDGEPVAALLAWVARETGRPVRYDPPAVERKARQTILHGDVRGLAPLEALEAMLATTDLTYDVRADGSIVVRSRVAL